jgi:ferredoxin
LSLTEVIKGSSHTFVVAVGTERGAEIMDALGAPTASETEMAAADDVAKDAALNMGRELNTDGLKYLMYANAESQHWDDVASRCLSCTNCTLVCPTCFCTHVEDTSALDGSTAERTRVWDTCFSVQYAEMHGGNTRPAPRARYRQWLTHKLATWEDQFGSLGCVGCGRCIAWCPVGIDIRAEVEGIRVEEETHAHA